ncbi:MFS transporter [Corynebacterium sp. CCM 9203]|uniref:MFS transporter n=1 Tax=Corynebacterium sp. CCM 9203 TaxID=3057615 RepID=UPI00352467AB
MTRLRELWQRPVGVPPLGRDAKILIAANSVNAIGSGMAGPYLILFLGHRLGGTAPATYFMTILVVDLVIQSLVTPRIEKRAGLRDTAVLGALFQALGWAALIFAGPATVVAAAILIGVGNGLFFSIRFNLQMRVTEPGSRPYAFSLRYLWGNLAVFVGTGLGALLIMWGGEPAIAGLMVANSVTFGLLALALAMMNNYRVEVDDSVDEKSPSGRASWRRGLVRVKVLEFSLYYLASLVFFGALTESVLPTQWVLHDGLPIAFGGVSFGVLAGLILVIQMPVTGATNDMSAAKTLLLSAGLAAASAIVSLVLRPLGWWWLQVPLCGALVAVAGAVSVVVPAKSLELFDGAEQAVQGRLFAFMRSVGIYVGGAVGALALRADNSGVYVIMLVGAAALAAWGLRAGARERVRTK